MRRYLVAVAGLLFAFSLEASTIEPENVLAAINAVRAEAGVSPLALDERVSLAAEDRMREMEEQGYWAHEGPGGESPFRWLAHRSYRFLRAGENLARGFETSEVMIEAWLESPGHRANLLSPNFTSIGVAIIDGFTTGRATGKSVVVMFADELPQ
jgi:uncharacterized protein YkwD